MKTAKDIRNIHSQYRLKKANIVIYAYATKWNAGPRKSTGVIENFASYRFPHPWQEGIAYGSVSDLAGQAYRTVMIGDKWWMAENLNYAGVNNSIGNCRSTKVDTCLKYGRLYNWAEAMAGSISSAQSPSGVQGICPNGWHIPSDSEWTAMQNIVGTPKSNIATKLKSLDGWKGVNSSIKFMGLDTYGFRALSSGKSYIDTTTQIVYSDFETGFWWSTTMGPLISTGHGSVNSAWGRRINVDSLVIRRSEPISDGLSLRCTKD